MRFLLFAVLPLLAACTTPREQCLSTVGVDLRVLNNLISETRSTIDRGFALETRQDIREVDTFCTTELPDGRMVQSTCQKVKIRDVRVPKAVDLNVEKAKLASLEERQQQLRANAAAARQQCIAANPE